MMPLDPLADDVIEAANHVLSHFDQGGYPGGSFTQALLEAMGRADQSNLRRIGLGFPVQVGCYMLAMEGDFETLRKLAS